MYFQKPERAAVWQLPHQETNVDAARWVEAHLLSDRVPLTVPANGHVACVAATVTPPPLQCWLHARKVGCDWDRMKYPTYLVEFESITTMDTRCAA